jgi:hypothetical protein
MASCSAVSCSRFMMSPPSQARGHPTVVLRPSRSISTISRSRVDTRVQCGEASKRPVSDGHFRARLKRASNDGLRRQAGGQADDAVRIGPGDQRGDLLVGTSGRNACGFDHAQDADGALKDAPLVHDSGEEVATE